MRLGCNYIIVSTYRYIMRSVFFLLALALALPLHAQENYFVTYSHELEEPGNLEIEAKSVTGAPKDGNAFVATALEFEYGVKTWWTSELYLDGQITAGESTVFTGFRWENRVRPLLSEHWINPILYFEFEDINAADVRQMMDRVHLVEDVAMGEDYPEKWPARVVATMKNGESFTAMVEYPKGDAKNPLTLEDLQDKFRALTGNILPPAEQERLRRHFDPADARKAESA